MEKEALLLLLKSVTLRETLVQSLGLIKSKLKNSYFDASSSDDGLVEDMSIHLKSVFNWAHFATEIEFITDKITNEVYIDLDYYITPRSAHPDDIDNQEKFIESRLIETVFQKTKKDIAVIGESGMGKTTSMKMIALKLVDDHEYLPYNFPIVVRLREVNFPNTYPHKQEFHIIKHIQNILGLKFSNRTAFEDAKLDIEILSKYVISYLDSLNALLILDGFDEVPIVHQNNAFKEIDLISLSCQSSRLIVTSRTENFKYSSSSIRQFQIVPLKDEQIQEFACKYLDDHKGLEFFKQLERSPFKDTSVRPLILAFLLTIFEHNEKLPARPTNLHSEIIDLLLAKWDKYRAIKRLSQFDDFEFQAKHDFLMDLSYELSKESKSKFTTSELNTVYQVIKYSYPSLPNDRIDTVLEEIEVHSGIFVKSGRMQYEFPHRSIQEYLTGEFIKNYVPITDLLPDIVKLPYETAIATTISKNPSNFFEIYTKELMNSKGSDEFQKNMDIYLNVLGNLKPIFKTSWKFAYQILFLYQNLFNGTPILDTPLVNIVNSDGVKRSFIQLEDVYKLEDPITYVMIKKEGKNFDKMIALRKREKKEKGSFFQDKIKSPALLLREWKFLKSLLK